MDMGREIFEDCRMTMIKVDV